MIAALKCVFRVCYVSYERAVIMECTTPGYDLVLTHFTIAHIAFDQFVFELKVIVRELSVTLFNFDLQA